MAGIEIVKVRRMANSLVISVPRSILDALGVVEGGHVSLQAREDVSQGLVLMRASAERPNQHDADRVTTSKVGDQSLEHSLQVMKSLLKGGGL